MRRKQVRYSSEFKAAVVRKVLTNPELSHKQIAREFGIAPASVYRWLDSAGERTMKKKQEMESHLICLIHYLKV